MRAFRYAAFFAVMLVILVWIAAQPKTVAPKVPNPNEIRMTGEMRRDVTALIQAHNLNCPEAKLSFRKGQDTYGAVIQVYCGPQGSDGVFEKAVFRLTMLPNNNWRVEPWKD